MVENILELKIILDKSNPTIWRRVLVPVSVTFFDLHHIIQISMGWKNAHLFKFEVGDYKIGIPDDEYDEDADTAHAGEVTLDLLLLKKGLTFHYVYDFGDWWQHTLKVEDILTKDDIVYPVCTGGEMACPREDSGGIPGHYWYLEILRDPKHPEYKEIKRWIGRGYDPQKFDLAKVNKELPKFKSYMKYWR
jgi:hypothetical protein